ncbi:MAG: hypothetical protein PHS79_04510 [Patescibacteria group bacterium]|nr:hypothetical protein [Patescibacteria group bacterium]
MPLPSPKSNVDALRVVDESETTPLCIGLKDVLRDHWRNLAREYSAFFARIGAAGRMPCDYSVPQSAGRFMQSVFRDNRRVCWCPPGINLFTDLYPYFDVQGIAIEYEQSMVDDPKIRRCESDVWIAYRAHCYNREADYRNDFERGHYPRPSSGVQLAIPLPNAVQMAYLIAWLIETEDSSALKLISSADERSLTFFRTSTRPTNDVIVAAAYLPGRRLILRTFRTRSAPDLKTMDAFILV